MRHEHAASAGPGVASPPNAHPLAFHVELPRQQQLSWRKRQPAQLDPWLQRAATSTLEALRRFATGLYEDYEAVKAGVTLPWSNGPVEGHIKRLKMLKRQMFGRAHLDLLRCRFLLAPRRAPRPQATTEARVPPPAVHPLHQKWVRTISLPF